MRPLASSKRADLPPCARTDRWPKVAADVLSHGPLNPLVRYQVSLRPHRYTALTTDGCLIAVVDIAEVATQTAREVPDRQLI
jgi:hypothetical protein